MPKRRFRKIGGFSPVMRWKEPVEYVEVDTDANTATSVKQDGKRVDATQFDALEQCLQHVKDGIWEEIPCTN